MLQAIAARRIVEWPPMANSPPFVQSAHEFPFITGQLYLDLLPAAVIKLLHGIEFSPVVSVLRNCKDDVAASRRAVMMLRANGYRSLELAAYSVVAFNPHVDDDAIDGNVHVAIPLALYCGNVGRVEQIINTPANVWVAEAVSPAQAMMNPTSWEWFVQTHDVDEAIVHAINDGVDPIRLSFVLPKPNDPAMNGRYTPPSRYYSAAASAASSNGDLSTLKWLHMTYGPGWTVAAIYAAAKPTGDHKALHYLLLNGCPHPASYDEFMLRVRIDSDEAFEDPDMFDGLGTMDCAARMFVQALECVWLRKRFNFYDPFMTPPNPEGVAAAAAAGPA